MRHWRDKLRCERNELAKILSMLEKTFENEEHVVGKECDKESKKLGYFRNQ